MNAEFRGQSRVWSLALPFGMAQSNLADLLPWFLERSTSQVQLEILPDQPARDLLNQRG